MTDNKDSFFETEESASSIEALKEKVLSSNDDISLFGVKGSFKSYVIAQLIKRTKKQFLVIAPKQSEAETMYNDISFFLNSAPVHFFPCLDTLPYDKIIPQIEVTAKRMQTLSEILSKDVRCVVTSTKALQRKVISKDILKDEQELIMTGEEIEREKFLNKLISWGYSRVDIVEDPGDFAVRGNIIDIYIPSYNGPARIELFGDFVECIRIFDPVTQRSIEDINELICFPVVDTIYKKETKRRAAAVITEICTDFDIEFAKRKEFVEKIKQEVYFSNLFEFVPAFYEKMDSIFDYLNDSLVIINLSPTDIRSVRDEYYTDIHVRYNKHIKEKNICLPPEMLYLKANEFDDLRERCQNINVHDLELIDKSTGSYLKFNVKENDGLRKRLLDAGSNKKDIFSEHIITDEPKDEIKHKLQGQSGALQPLIDILDKGLKEKKRIYITARTTGQAERLCELIDNYDTPHVFLPSLTPSLIKEGDDIRAGGADRVIILKGSLSKGFICDREGIITITEEEIFGERVKRSVKGRKKLDHFLSSLADLKTDDFIVHVDHGIGIYKGLKNIEVEGIKKDFLMIEFAGKDILYLPVDRLNLVMKYSGLDNATPKLDKLGGVSWGKVKSRVKKSIEVMAQELLKIDAKRKLNKGYAFSKGDHYYNEFEASFEFEETPDQLCAINDVTCDMEEDRPMDRLICGDVGFGKTEVAIRAAFKAVMDGKQAAVLVPTTILAQQHFKTFTDRFKGYPFVIEMLSRFKTAGEQKEIKKGLKEGNINIVIGTHALLSKDVGFLDLGLVVIDEEQRFGVRHKEKLKQMKATVDVLTLTATPIPRTLYMALSGIRGISIINTPPLDRLSIRTIITKFDDEAIKESVTRELKRDGQVFFVHNRVQTIFDTAAYLRKLVPAAKVAVAHGQMHEKELETIMARFINKEYDLLVSTAIIESGLDIPSANTIIIDHADAFGLAQLYQLRGRVGRGKVRAYSYLIIHSEEKITKDAVKRLNALLELSELGSGYKIAMYDLEIRGGGNLLGKDQSGNIIAIGFDFYTQLLEQVINEMKGIETEIQIEPEVNINMPALIPDEYIDEINQRLVIYQRVSNIKSIDNFNDLKDELIDRFGKFPKEVKNLFELMQLRFLMKKLLIASLDYKAGEIILNFDPHTRFDLKKLLDLVKQAPGKYRFSGEWRFAVNTGDKEKPDMIKDIKEMLIRVC
jgi:transcription-repair coupling factor (superfamily II helicase)